MILRIKIIPKKRKKEERIVVWIQNHKDLREEIQQLFTFFNDDISVKKRVLFHTYYEITSENPAIMLSLISTVQELIPEVFFNTSNKLNIEFE